MKNLTPEKLIEEMGRSYRKWWDNKHVSNEVREHDRKHLRKALEVVLKHLRNGDIIQKCKTCYGTQRVFDGWTNGYNFSPVVKKEKDCPDCKYGYTLKPEFEKMIGE